MPFQDIRIKILPFSWSDTIYEICKMIKDHKKYNEVPIYLLTAIPGSEVEKKMQETKADGFILKPFDFADFEVVFQYLYWILVSTKSFLH